ncbi:DEAD-box ATP-dependent RNA helicase 13 [Aristolochia californica]|uniref:DEAD-box ATP-dependent RNA helicase 13 n=1 Tax=Aristolochia californica TaxID=171875 RepID=UPI0035E18716
MAAQASPAPSSKKKTRSKHHDQPDIHSFNGLPWCESLAIDDPFAFLVGSSHGGFLTLEEIDESSYGIIPSISDGREEKFSILSKFGKRKRKHDNEGSEDDTTITEVGSQDVVEKEKKVKKKKKKKAGEKLKKEKIGSVDNKLEDEPENEAKDKNNRDSVFHEDEFPEWNELRLHPLLMKAIYNLGFREPTPIQKACIPAAAHQGKDVIGAAETGSGKTLAFGLPILQRLLEEREKAAKKAGIDQELLDKVAQENPLRALVVTPTRELALQVSDHLKEAARFCNIHIVPIVGGMSTEKQERLLKKRPQIIVGTPGRLWELMSGGHEHLIELQSLSFFVLDEADRMIENGHFHELQSIIDLLPTTKGPNEGNLQSTKNCETILSLPRKKRQTFVFSATIALSANFRKKLKHGSTKLKSSLNDGISSMETLSERAGMRADAAIIDLTNASIVAHKLEESFIECKEEDKEAYLYYLLSVHGRGRTIVFCTSIAALRRISSFLRILGITVWTLHAQMQQRARLKAVDRFRISEHGTLVATDVAARGLDIPGIRTVVHYQLPHSAEVYIHRSGRTARASADGCSIALISPTDRSKFASLCKSFAKESLQRFPIDNTYMSEIFKRLSLAHQIDKISRKNSQEKAKKSWFQRNSESVELLVDENDSEEEQVTNSKQRKQNSLQLKKLQQELNNLLARPLQPKSFSRRFLAGAGISPLLQQQLEVLALQKVGNGRDSNSTKGRNLVVIGQECIEPLQALRSAGHEVTIDIRGNKDALKRMENRRSKKREEKKRLREQRKKERRKMKERVA